MSGASGQPHRSEFQRTHTPSKNGQAISSSPEGRADGGDGHMAADLENKKSGRGAAAATTFARRREARAVPRKRKSRARCRTQVASAQCTYSPENPSGRQILIVSVFNDIKWWRSGNLENSLKMQEQWHNSQTHFQLRWITGQYRFNCGEQVCKTKKTHILYSVDRYSGTSRVETTKKRSDNPLQRN